MARFYENIVSKNLMEINNFNNGQFRLNATLYDYPDGETPEFRKSDSKCKAIIIACLSDRICKE